MAATKKTDNHFLADKVALRSNHLPSKIEIKVLDVFAGRGTVWKAVAKKTGTKIKRTAIDKRVDLTEMHLHGDNCKIMQGLPLEKFDVIDVDAYGIPADQLALVFRSRFRGTVFVTAIQTMQGQIPNTILSDLGFPEAVQKKAPSLPPRRGWVLLKQWLAMNGVTKIHHRSWRRKHYFTFCIADVEAD